MNPSDGISSPSEIVNPDGKPVETRFPRRFRYRITSSLHSATQAWGTISIDSKSLVLCPPQALAQVRLRELVLEQVGLVLVQGQLVLARVVALLVLLAELVEWCFGP